MGKARKHELEKKEIKPCVLMPPVDSSRDGVHLIASFSMFYDRRANQ